MMYHPLVPSLPLVMCTLQVMIRNQHAKKICQHSVAAGKIS